MIYKTKVAQHRQNVYKQGVLRWPGKVIMAKQENSNNWLGLVVLLIWLGLVILSVGAGHFNVPERLSNSWNHFMAVSLGEKLLGIGRFLVLVETR